MSAGSEPSSFWIELKQRKVYHTTAAYGAAVFVVWQAADIAVPALGLPPGLLRFVVVAALLGFPVAIGLSWTFEVVREPPRPSPDVPRRLLRRPLLLTLIVVPVVGALAWVAAPRGALALPQGAWVLIADVQNETGDPALDGVLDGALRLSLAQSLRVTAFPEARVRQGLREMRRPESSAVDAETAVELALRQGVGAVVTPTIRRVGTRYVVEASLVEPASEATVASRSQTADDVDELLDAVDALARQLRRDLGESLRSLVRAPIHLPQATTGSLEALKAWSDGLRDSRAGRDREASVHFLRAVELDSTFALAQAALGQWYYWNANDAVRGDSAFDRALAHLDGVSERERLSIRGTVAEWRGQRDVAATWYGAMTTIAPSDPIAWSRLAYVYLRMSRRDEATAAYERVLALDSMDANAWSNLATLRYGAGDLAAAVALYERAFTLQPDLRTRPVLNEEYGHDLVLLGRFDEAEALYRHMLEGASTARARGLRSMALMSMYRGRHREAAERLREAVVLHHGGGASISELRDRAFLSVALRRQGLAGDADREIPTIHDLAVQTHTPTLLVNIAGVLEARAGRPIQATELLDSAIARSNGSPEDQAAIEHLHGEIALAEGDVARAQLHLDAAAALDPARGQGGAIRIAASLARAALAGGDRKRAVELLQEVAQASGSATSRESQDEWIIAYYTLGRVQEELGRRAEAQAAYQRFLIFWGDGTPLAPEAADARRRLADLLPG